MTGHFELLGREFHPLGFHLLSPDILISISQTQDCVFKFAYLYKYNLALQIFNMCHYTVRHINVAALSSRLRLTQMNFWVFVRCIRFHSADCFPLLNMYISGYLLLLHNRVLNCDANPTNFVL